MKASHLCSAFAGPHFQDQSQLPRSYNHTIFIGHVDGYDVWVGAHNRYSRAFLSAADGYLFVPPFRSAVSEFHRQRQAPLEIIAKVLPLIEAWEAAHVR